jgi:HEAT repeat protein
MSHRFEQSTAALQSPDVRERSQAVLQLQPGTGDADAAIASLVSVLCTDDDLNVVEDATWVLVRYGAAATSALLEALTEGKASDARARHNLVHTLGKLADVRALPTLLTAAEDVEPTVRMKAVYALGQIGDTRAINTLIMRLDDPVQNVSWTAREVLQGFGGAAFDGLIAALSGESAQVRELAANLLGDLGDARAVDALSAALSTDDWQVRFAIVEALGAIGDARALPSLERLLDDPQPPVRALAARMTRLLKQP